MLNSVLGFKEHRTSETCAWLQRSWLAGWVSIPSHKTTKATCVQYNKTGINWLMDELLGKPLEGKDLMNMRGLQKKVVETGIKT